MAEAAATEEGVPRRWREDAVAEYVAYAWKAGQEADTQGNPRAYQCRMGRGAIQNFLRRERRQEALAPGSCSVGAKRVTLDKMVLDSGGEWIPLAETIEDRDIPQPDARMLANERNEAVKRAVDALPPLERQVAQLILMKGLGQEEAAEALGVTRKIVRGAVSRATKVLRERLSEYRDAFNRTRF